MYLVFLLSILYILFLRWQEAVRGDHGEVANLLVKAGGKVLNSQGNLVELSGTRMAGNVRMYGEEYNPEWELDPADLEMMEKLGSV